MSDQDSHPEQLVMKAEDRRIGIATLVAMDAADSDLPLQDYLDDFSAAVLAITADARTEHVARVASNMIIGMAAGFLAQLSDTERGATLATILRLTDDALKARAETPDVF